MASAGKPTRGARGLASLAFFGMLVLVIGQALPSLRDKQPVMYDNSF